MNFKPLSELVKGEFGVIKSIQDGALSLKLMELGCMPGEPIRLNAVSPFGDPIAIKVAGYTLSLRLADAQLIMVESKAEHRLSR